MHKMPHLNNRATERWKADSAASVDFYNEWFLSFAPPSFRAARAEAVREVECAFRITKNGKSLDAGQLMSNPRVLAVARQMTCPPLARDRLAGLSGVSYDFLKRCEESTGALPDKISNRVKLQSAIDVIAKMLDRDILTWLSDKGGEPSSQRRNRAALVIADRLCGSLADPILRNAQEKRQLSALSDWLVARGYGRVTPKTFSDMAPGQFAIHVNMPCRMSAESSSTVNVSVDMAVLPKTSSKGDLPILFEAKSAGDFTNVNKRRKEEAKKMEQLHGQYGHSVRYILFLCGYFDATYLGYEAAEGIDWIWEHRIDDMEALGL